MTTITLAEIHGDLETLKKDVADLKSAILDNEGELSVWAKERILHYGKRDVSGNVSQETMEKEFL